MGFSASPLQVAVGFGTGGDDNVFASFPSNVTAGSLLVAVVGWQIVIGVPDTVRNDGTNQDWVKACDIWDAGNNAGISIWYFKNSAAETTAAGKLVTAKWTGGHYYRRINISEWSGGDLTAPLDKIATAAAAFADTTDAVTTGLSGTPAVDGELFICGGYSCDYYASWLTHGTGFALMSANDDGHAMAGMNDEYLIQTTKASAAGTWTQAINGKYVQVALATFKPAGGAALLKVINE